MIILREFVNSRHPDPRRMWKGGSEPQLMTPDPVDPVDWLDPVACSKVGARLDQTLYLVILDPKWVAMAPFGLRINQNDATWIQ